MTLARDLEISREACARRWIELREEPLAVVFSKDGLVRYVQRQDGFPFVCLNRGDRLPPGPRAADLTGLSSHEAADARDWLGRTRDDLVIQTLHQQEGFTMTLLMLDGADPLEAEPVLHRR
jgi:hypothetical protein